MKKPLFRLWFVVGVMLALSITYWAGCSKTPNEPTAQETTLRPTSSQALAVMAVQDRYTDNLMAHPEVVGTATGLTEDGKPAIVILTKSDMTTKTDIKIESLKKGVAPVAIPASIEDVPVVVMVTGEIKALKGGGGGVNHKARFTRPVPLGISTGHPSITAGTIGARVKDAQGNVFALSNNHVYAATNFLDCTANPPLWNCALGDPVIQPGTFDGGSTPADNIGNVVNFKPIDFSPGANNDIDAAIASTTTALLDKTTTSDCYGTPKSQTIAPAVNMKVKKCGRTTGFTTGSIFAINATIDVNYADPGEPDLIATYMNQIVITPGTFSAGGDSGSLIVVNGKGPTQNDDLKPVGLLFAGSQFSTIANPIGAVLAYFNVSIDGQ